MKERCVEEKVLRCIRENAMLETGDDVTVALSGGADSVALLWVLRTLAPTLGLTLRAAHFHHGLRGAEADRDADFCAKLCADWEIPFSLGRGNAAARAAETGESVEEAARREESDTEDADKDAPEDGIPAVSTRRDITRPKVVLSVVPSTRKRMIFFSFAIAIPPRKAERTGNF